ncbi:MAG: hypothetical protein AAB853_05330 [Patescibacteria group bacterium]
MKSLLALAMGFHLALGNLVLAGVAFTVPVGQAIAAEPAISLVTPLSSEEISMSIVMTPALPSLPVTQGAQSGQGEESILACADTQQSALHALGSHSLCPTDRCLRTQDDRGSPSETSLALRSPTPDSPMMFEGSFVPTFASLGSQNAIDAWGPPPLVSLLATVVLRA